MTFRNRIKCAASIDSNGAVVLGDAKVGFRPLAAGWAAVNGEYAYLLEDDTNLNNWEIGLVLVRNGVAVTFSGKKRKIIDSSTGAGFANLTGGLTFSQGATASSVWAGGVGTSGAQAAGSNLAAGPGAKAIEPYTSGGIAIGSGAIATGDGDVAIGYGATTKLGYGVAIGKGATSSFSGEVALGSDWLTPSVHFLPMKAVIYAAGTEAFTTADPFFPSIDFATWALTNRQPGPLRISGRATAGVPSAGLNGARVVDFDYMLWAEKAGGGTVSVMGTPAFTVVYSGSAAMAITFSVQSTTGALMMTTPGAGNVVARALARIDNLACG